MSIKIAVVANCQARPIAQILPLLNPAIEISTTAIVHLLSNENEAEYSEFFSQADFIVAQQVADNYPCEFVRQGNLVDRYGDKVLTIVNLYYSGYTPDLRYLRIPGQGTLRGPLGDYHIETIFQSWREGISHTDALKRLESLEYNRRLYSGVHESSIGELRERESRSNIEIVDSIEERLAERRLFFSFNHPSMFLLEHLCRQILKKAELERGIFRKQLRLNETLDQFIPPVNCFSAEKLGIKFKNKWEYKGVEVSCSTDGSVIIGERKYYKPADIAGLFYKIYDSNRSLIEENHIQ